ncbi:MAG: kelch repeat-containing protein [SAR202 cluster bacterium]|nr:kelch repeat-containing protein [SAR202 cluster bacterium]
MTRRRIWLQATLLEDGTALEVGGRGNMSTPRPTADIYYLATNTWSPTDQFFRDRFDHSETILGDGSVLIAGCMSGDPQAPTLATTAPVYDPAARYLALVNGPAKARHDHGEILLFDGTVLVVGGRILEGEIIASAEIFDPSNGRWRSAGSLQRASRSPVLNVLVNRTVLARVSFDDEDCLTSSGFSTQILTFGLRNSLPGVHGCTK